MGASCVGKDNAREAKADYGGEGFGCLGEDCFFTLSKVRKKATLQSGQIIRANYKCFPQLFVLATGGPGPGNVQLRYSLASLASNGDF